MFILNPVLIRKILFFWKWPTTVAAQSQQHPVSAKQKITSGCESLAVKSLFLLILKRHNSLCSVAFTKTGAVTLRCRKKNSCWMSFLLNSLWFTEKRLYSTITVCSDVTSFTHRPVKESSLSWLCKQSFLNSCISNRPWKRAADQWDTDKETSIHLGIR